MVGALKKHVGARDSSIFSDPRRESRRDAAARRSPRARAVKRMSNKGGLKCNNPWKAVGQMQMGMPSCLTKQDHKVCRLSLLAALFRARQGATIVKDIASRCGWRTARAGIGGRKGKEERGKKGAGTNDGHGSRELIALK